jgi:hypothetical protein
MPKKADLRRIRRIARECGILPAEYPFFGDYVEDCKRHADFGSGPRGDFNDDELREKAEEYKQGRKRN